MEILIRMLIAAGAIFLMYAALRFNTYYFAREDVVARRVARARLPHWLNSLEMFTWPSLYMLIVYLSIRIIASANRDLHPNTYLPVLTIFPVIIGALPLAMLLSNVVFWTIPYTRQIENKNAIGVPGASFKEANLGLVKFALVVEPVCVLIMLFGLGLL